MMKMMMNLQHELQRNNQERQQETTTTRATPATPTPATTTTPCFGTDEQMTVDAAVPDYYDNDNDDNNDNDDSIMPQSTKNLIANAKKKRRQKKRKRILVVIVLTILLLVLLVVVVLGIFISRSSSNNNNNNNKNNNNTLNTPSPQEPNTNDDLVDIFVGTRGGNPVTTITPIMEPIRCQDLLVQDPQQQNWFPLSFLVNLTEQQEQQEPLFIVRIPFQYSLDIGHLCMVVQTNHDNTVWIPIARSYDGYGWESYHRHHHHRRHGDDLFSTTTTMNFQQEQNLIVCNDNTRICYLSLPWQQTTDEAAAAASASLEEEDENNILQYAVVARSWINKEDHYQESILFSRFLEQTTFGTTRSDLNDLQAMRMTTNEQQQQQGSSSSIATLQSTTWSIMAKWIHEQMYTIQPTYHRVFYRQHVNGRFESSSPIGHVTHPCHLNSAYRQFAFVEKHMGQVLEIRTIVIPNTSTTKQLLLVDQIPLTMVDGPIQFVQSPNPFLSTNNLADGT